MNQQRSLLVLVADDDDLVRKSLQRRLERLGCDVLLAEDGEVAMRLAIDASPAVIFLDLNMPGIDGHTLLRRLPAAGVEASIVVMSAAGRLDDAIDAIRTGAVDYLKKPWTSTDLVSALARAVAVSRAIDETETPETFARFDDAVPPFLGQGGRPSYQSGGGIRSSTVAHLRLCSSQAPVGIDPA